MINGHIHELNELLELYGRIEAELANIVKAQANTINKRTRLSTTLRAPGYTLRIELHVGSYFYQLTMDISPAGKQTSVAWLRKEVEVGFMKIHFNVVQKPKDLNGILGMPDGFNEVWTREMTVEDKMLATAGWFATLVPKPAN